MDNINQWDKSLLGDLLESSTSQGHNKQAWLSTWEKQAFKVSDQNSEFAAKESVEEKSVIATPRHTEHAVSELPLVDNRLMIASTPVAELTKPVADVQKHYQQLNGIAGQTSPKAGLSQTAATPTSHTLKPVVRGGAIEGIELPANLQHQLRQFAARLLPAKDGYTLWLRDYSKNHLNALKAIVDAVSEQLNAEGHSLTHLTFNGQKMSIEAFKRYS